MADNEVGNTVWNLINDLSTKKGITEIIINDPKTVFVEREGRFIQLNVNLTKTHLYDFIKEVARVNKGLCTGCGTCVSACPSGVIDLEGFTDDEVFAELLALEPFEGNKG